MFEHKNNMITQARFSIESGLGLSYLMLYLHNELWLAILPAYIYSTYLKLPFNNSDYLLILLRGPCKQDAY